MAFSYKDSKRVLWNYDCNMMILGEETRLALQKRARISVSTCAVGGTMTL
ncbi:hypothetical protein Gotri_019365 [Gossypium trilobum]|uniref:Uncharacterized protein n=1 Tax=Gossypium trilobum TaxID=34281 RepID=A0A7J9ECM5_9ROSI|nr:hypothetical protein [Gossypium trilobum]